MATRGSKSVPYLKATPVVKKKKKASKKTKDPNIVVADEKPPSKVEFFDLQQIRENIVPPKFKGNFYPAVIPLINLLIIDYYCEEALKQGYMYVKDWYVPEGIMILFRKKGTYKGW